MVFSEPKVELLSIDIGNDIATATGANYTICEKVAGTALSMGTYCADFAIMIPAASDMNSYDFCVTYNFSTDPDPTMQGWLHD